MSDFALVEDGRWKAKRERGERWTLLTVQHFDTVTVTDDEVEEDQR